MGNYIQTNSDGFDVLVNLDGDKIKYVFCDQASVICKLSSGIMIVKKCHFDIEAKMIYAKIKKILGINEELNEWLSDSQIFDPDSYKTDINKYSTRIKRRDKNGQIC